jgi:UDP-N-acetylmuramate: L-alanyl-gamma-D-glutamyl-meso-diaminopimelate ligase
MRIHFVGICGVAMGSLALAFKQAGYKITGSDVGFFPPMSVYLKNAGVEYYPGWHPEKMIADGKPDLVIVGNVASSTNPEWIYVQENHLSYFSYPEAVAEFFVKEKSIVCAGTYGKTTTSALLSFILTEAGLNPSYMFGGLTSNNFPSARITDGNISILEGDEYKSARWDNSAKFFHYRSTHLLLTAVEWDHADIYPTTEEYYSAFDKLVKSIPNNGVIVLSEKVKNIEKIENIKTFTYGKNNYNDFQYSEIEQGPEGIKLSINNKEKKYQLNSFLLGEHQAENICGAFAMACVLGIEPKKTIAAITKFPGLKRRLEKRGVKNNAPIYDDIAHSPAKATSALASLRAAYPNDKITAIFEPNTGNRQPEAIPQYANAFTNADEIIIPKLTKIKINPQQINRPLTDEELVKIISTTHPHTHYLPRDQELVSYLKQKTQPGNVIVFLGSHGFRGMIESLI